MTCTKCGRTIGDYEDSYTMKTGERWCTLCYGGLLDVDRMVGLEREKPPRKKAE